MARPKQYNLYFLNDYFENDMESILPILKMYLAETPKELSAIEAALQRNDASAAKAGTHKIKTNIAMLGIVDQSSFVEEMHLLRHTDNVSEMVLGQFKIFSKNITEALEQMRHDFFSGNKP